MRWSGLRRGFRRDGEGGRRGRGEGGPVPVACDFEACGAVGLGVRLGVGGHLGMGRVGVLQARYVWNGNEMHEVQRQEEKKGRLAIDGLLGVGLHVPLRRAARVQARYGVDDVWCWGVMGMEFTGWGA